MACIASVILLAHWHPRPGLSHLLLFVSPGLYVCAGLHIHHSDMMGSCSHIADLGQFPTERGKAVASGCLQHHRLCNA